MTTDAWNPLDSPVDFVLIAGRRTPGLATVEGAGSPRKWDERGGPNTGSTLVFRGIKPTPFEVKIRLLTVQDWVDWQAFRPIVQRPPDRQHARALDVEHPLLEQVGVRSAVVEDVLQPDQTGDGEYTITIKMKEWLPPRPALARPTGSADRPPAPDPIDQEIELLTRQVQALAP